MPYVNLFGDPVPGFGDMSERVLTDVDRKRLKRRAADKPKGYARPPGTGPKGETCKSCALSYAVQSGARKTFWKCRLVKATRGPGSDIRIKSPACARFEKKDPA